MSTSGRSMRVGAAQGMMIAGLDYLVIMQAGGWKTNDVVACYVENAVTRNLCQRRRASMAHCANRWALRLEQRTPPFLSVETPAQCLALHIREAVRRRITQSLPGLCNVDRVAAVAGCTAGVRFVLATGYAKGAGELERLGAEAVLRKPFWMTEIEQLLVEA